MTDRDLTTRESFVLNTSPIILKDGILFKKRDHMKGWRPRYFTLDKDFLHYYVNEDDISPRKSLQICRDIIIRPGVDKKIAADGVVYYPFVISHPNTTDTYHLSAQSQAECKAWVSALRDVINSKHEEIAEIREVLRLIPEIDDADDDSGSVPPRAPTSNNEAWLENVPTQFAHKLQLAVDTLLNCSLDTSDDWTPMFDRHGVKATRRGGTGTICVRGLAVLPYTIPEVYKVVSQQRKELDAQLAVYKRAKWYSVHSGVEYLRFKPLWPTAARDFCNFTHWRLLPDGTFLTLGFSEKFDSLCPEEVGVVRADLILGGYVMRPVQGGTMIWIVVQVIALSVCPCVTSLCAVSWQMERAAFTCIFFFVPLIHS